MGEQGKSGGLAGCYSLLVTPFEEDGRVDYFAFEGLLEQQRRAGAFGVAVGFPCGEAGALRREELLTLVGQASLTFGGRVLAGCFALSTSEAIALAKLSFDGAADALFCPPPVGCRSGQSGYFKHLREMENAVSLPLLLARTGGKSGLSLCPEQLSVQSAFAVAEQGAPLAESALLMQKIGQTPLFCTKDSLLYPSLAIGFSGALSLLSCLYPREIRRLFDEMKKGHHARSLALWQALVPLCAYTESAQGVGFVKWILYRRGLCTPTLRLPLTLPDFHSLSAFEKECKDFERTVSLLFSEEKRERSLSARGREF
jgi:4-hydroxy-tetrahydrodipicolinate synthase